MKATLVPAISLWVATIASTVAFTPLAPPKRTALLLRMTPPTTTAEEEVEVVTDVQDAVDLIVEAQQELPPPPDLTDPDVEVLIENEPIETSATKEELLGDIQEMIEENITIAEATTAAAAETAPTSTEEPPAAQPTGGLAGSIQKTLRRVADPGPKVTPEEAAVSASLYMNPATAKIAQSLRVTWEPEVADILRRLEQVSNPNRPFLVGVVGVPGSGKSTSSEILAALLGRAIVMPMDGFHIPLAELAEFENPADAIYRRGAPDTFYADRLGAALTRIAHGDEAKVTIPGFDHAVGDPTPDQHTFEREKHQIVICEGLYLLHNADGWENIKSFFDWTIYIDANVDACIERLKERNKCIPGYTPEEIEIRCDVVDRANAITSREGAYKYACQIVKSGASS